MSRISPATGAHWARRSLFGCPKFRTHPPLVSSLTNRNKRSIMALAIFATAQPSCVLLTPWARFDQRGASSSRENEESNAI